MIIGDYYINNVLLAIIVLALLGVSGYFAGVPEMIGTNDSSTNGNVSYQLMGDDSLNPSGSGVVTLVDSGGEPVSGAEVFVNDQQVGMTDEKGSISFDVPNSSNVTVSASTSDTEVRKVFDVEDTSQEDSEDRSEDDENGGETGGNNDENSGEGSEEGDSSDENSSEESEEGKDNETSKEDENNTIDAEINRLRPENKQLQSPSFEASYQFIAENASYRILLGEEEKRTGSVEGERNVSENLSMPVNGTSTLRAEIFKENETLVSDNHTLNYSAEEMSEGGDSEENQTGNETGDPAEVDAGLSAPSSVNVDSQIELDASDSSGDIVNYTWRLGDGTVETTDEPTLTHSYQNEGSYEILLTVNGENNTEANASSTVEVQGTEEPVVNILEPSDNYETDQDYLDIKFEANNTLSEAGYEVFIDGSSEKSGTLNQGNNTVQETADIPEKAFNISVQVNQEGNTYTSQKRTVNATKASQMPDYLLKNPDRDQNIEIQDSKTSINFEYEITDRKWATSANLTVKKDGNKIEERPVSVASGTYTEEVSELEPGNYSYEIEVTDGDKTDSKMKDFNINQVEPEYSVSQESPVDSTEIGEDNPDDFQNVDFNVSYETDTDATVKFEIIAMENESNTYTTGDGAGGEQEWTTEYDKGQIVNNQSTEILEGMNYHKVFENTFDVAMRYKWRSWISVDGEEEKTTEFRSFNVTEEPS